MAKKLTSDQRAAKVVLGIRLASLRVRVEKAASAYSDAADALKRATRDLKTIKNSKTGTTVDRTLAWAISEAIQRAGSANVELVYAQQELTTLLLDDAAAR